MLNVLTDPTTVQSVYDFSTIDTSQVVPTIISIMSAVAGVYITCILIKKGFYAVFRAIKRA